MRAFLIVYFFSVTAFAQIVNPGALSTGYQLYQQGVQYYQNNYGAVAPDPCQGSGGSTCEKKGDKLQTYGRTSHEGGGGPEKKEDKHGETDASVDAAASGKEPQESETSDDAVANNPTQTPAYRAAEAAIQQCESDASSVAGSCSTDKNSLQAAGFTAADSFAQNLNIQDFSSVGNCQAANAYSGGANGALAAIKGYCSRTYDTCRSSCNEATSKLSDVPLADRGSLRDSLSAAKKTCSSALARMSSIDSNIAQIQDRAAKAQNCVNDVANAQSLALSQLQAECAANPSQKKCEKLTNCYNPQYAATQPACLCIANPTSPSCTGQANFASTDPYRGGGSGNSDEMAPAGDSASLDSFGGRDEFAGADRGNPSGAGGGGGHGLGGGDAPMGGGSAKGANQPREKNAGAGSVASATARNILAGRYGPAAAAGGPSAGRPLPKNVGTYRRNGSWIPPRVTMNDLNLDRFRPAGLRMYRGPGSTANGLLRSDVDIWKQMNFRYDQTGPSLLQSSRAPQQ